MSDRDVWRIILVAEGPTDERRISHLIDHFLTCRHVSAALDDLRRYEGLGGQPFIRFHQIPELARQRNLDRRFSSNGSRKGDGGAIRKLFQILQKEKLLGPRTVVVWSRDDDGDSERRMDVENALTDLPTSGPWLRAIARECGEAWVIAGWSPTTKSDEQKLQELRQRLGFAPHEYPDRLSHKENVPKSAKAVLDEIFGGDRDRENEALVAASRANSRASEACGLQSFCAQAETWLIA